MSTLESRLVIRATDETAKAFDDVQKRIAQVEKSAAEVERVFANIGRITNDVSLFGGLAQRGEMDAAVANMEKLISLTEKASAAQRGLAQSAKVAGGALAAEGRAGEMGVRPLAAPRSAGKKSHGGIVSAATAGFVQFEGLLPVVAAIETFEVGKKAVENAAELEQMRFRIRELSKNDPSEAPLADRLASDVSSKYPGITRAKALDTYSELRANSVDANGRVDPAVATRNLMAAARAQNAALALGFEMTPADTQNLLKGVEGSGRADDPKAVEKITDAYLRAKQVFGSAIASDMIRDYTANAKSANFSIGDDQFYLSNMVRMSEGNASRLGNEVNQTLATMVGGHMTKATGAWMVAHGLATADQIVKTGPGTISIKGGLKDEATLQTNQSEWAATTLRKAIEDSGAISEDKVGARADMLRAQELKRNPNAEIDARFLRERAEEGLIAAELAKTGMRSTVTDNLAHFIGNQRLLERDTAAMLNASGSAAGDRISQNPVAAFAELSSAISNFGTALVSPAIANSGPLLDGLARGINSLANALPGFYESVSKGVKTLINGPEPTLLPIDIDRRVSKAYWDRKSYFHDDLDETREHNRGISLDHLQQGGHTSPLDVNVEGNVIGKFNVVVSASSELLSVYDSMKQLITQIPLNPNATGHGGRMDSDAAPGHGGIGSR